MKTLIKIIKWWFLFWIYLFAASLATAVIGGILAGLLGIEVNIGVMVLGFTVILIAEHVLRGKRKKAAAEAEVRKTVEAEEARREAARLKNEYAAAIDNCRISLEGMVRQIKDKPTAAKVTDIAVLLRKIALEVESDPRDRKKVRSLSDHTGHMIVDLVEKYIKLERQGQNGSNITSAMWEISSALDTVKTSLETLLDDLFSNDGAEVSANVAVLESILAGINPEYRINLGMDEAAAPEGEVTADEN